MSEVIDSFLVALGFEVDEKSVKDTTGAIKGVRTNALAMGAALSTAFAGIGVVAGNSAKRMDELGNSAKLLSNISTSDLDKYRYIFEKAGGSPADADSTFDKLESWLSNLKKLGEIGPFENLEKIGLPSSFLMDAKTSVDLFERLAEIIPRLSPEDQNLASEKLGLNRGADLLLRRGQDTINQWMSDAERIGVITDRMAESAEKYLHTMQDLSRGTKIAADSFSAPFVDALSDTLDSWVGDSGVDQDFFDYIGGLFGERIKRLSAPESGSIEDILLWASRNFSPQSLYEDIKLIRNYDPLGKENSDQLLLKNSLVSPQASKRQKGLDSGFNDARSRNMDFYSVPVDVDVSAERQGGRSPIEQTYNISAPIKVIEATNGKEIGEKIIQHINSETTKAAESIKTNVQG